MNISLENYPHSNIEEHYPVNSEHIDFDADVTELFKLADMLEVAGVPKEKEVFLFVFHSEEDPNTDPEILLAFDEKALIAAEDVQEFLFYRPFKGLSFCAWKSLEAARIATSSPEHRAAAAYASQAYLRWKLELVIIARSAEGNEIDVIARQILKHWQRDTVNN